MWNIARIYEPKFLLFFTRIAVLIVIIILTPCGIFEKMTSFSPIHNQDLEQGKLMAAVNSRK